MNRKLLHERAFAEIIVIAQFFKQPQHHWQDLFANLKFLGTSDKTLASILNVWIEEGIIEKIPAPFPFRTKYALRNVEKLVQLWAGYLHLKTLADEIFDAVPAPIWYKKIDNTKSVV